MLGYVQTYIKYANSIRTTVITVESCVHVLSITTAMLLVKSCCYQFYKVLLENDINKTDI